jgi:hypothetical protein
LFSQFFEGKATEHWIVPGVEPEHFDDTRIGPVLDKLLPRLAQSRQATESSNTSFLNEFTDESVLSAELGLRK